MLKSPTQIDVTELAKTANALPPLSATTSRIVNILSDPMFDVRILVRTIGMDPSLSAALLQSANSAAQGASREVANVRDAVVRLGAGTVVAMAVAAAAKPDARLDLSAFGMTQRQFWRHCVASLAAAEELQARQIARFGPGFCTAALLHDYGKMILSEHVTPERLQAIKAFHESQPGRSNVDAEIEILGIDHALAGGMVIHHWNLPDDIASAIENHHCPVEWSADLTNGVILANEIANEIDGGNDSGLTQADNVADAMMALGVTEKLYQDVFDTSRSRFESLLSLFE